MSEAGTVAAAATRTEAAGSATPLISRAGMRLGPRRPSFVTEHSGDAAQATVVHWTRWGLSFVSGRVEEVFLQRHAEERIFHHVFALKVALCIMVGVAVFAAGDVVVLGLRAALIAGNAGIWWWLRRHVRRGTFPTAHRQFGVVSAMMTTTICSFAIEGNVLVDAASERTQYPFFSVFMAGAFFVALALPARYSLVGAAISFAVDLATSPVQGDIHGPNIVLIWATYVGIGLAAGSTVELPFRSNFVAAARARRAAEDADQGAVQARHLLENIFPRTLVDAQRGRSGAFDVTLLSARFEEAVVIQLDIVGFSSIAQTVMSSDELVRMLDLLFSQLDDLTRRRKVEKIKTVGDSYVAVAGVPVSFGSSAAAVGAAIRFALDVLRVFGAMRARGKPIAATKLQARIGIGTGPCVAGVLGKTKFVYDLITTGDPDEAQRRAADAEAQSRPGCIRMCPATSAVVAAAGGDLLNPEQCEVEQNADGTFLVWLAGQGPGAWMPAGLPLVGAPGAADQVFFPGESSSVSASVTVVDSVYDDEGVVDEKERHPYLLWRGRFADPLLEERYWANYAQTGMVRPLLRALVAVTWALPLLYELVLMDERHGVERVALRGATIPVVCAAMAAVDWLDRRGSGRRRDVETAAMALVTVLSVVSQIFYMDVGPGAGHQDHTTACLRGYLASIGTVEVALLFFSTLPWSRIAALVGMQQAAWMALVAVYLPLEPAIEVWAASLGSFPFYMAGGLLLQQALHRSYDVNFVMTRARQAAEAQRTETESLLHAILPQHIVARLQQAETMIADAIPQCVSMFVEVDALGGPGTGLGGQSGRGGAGAQRRGLRPRRRGGGAARGREDQVPHGGVLLRRRARGRGRGRERGRRRGSPAGRAGGKEHDARGHAARMGHADRDPRRQCNGGGHREAQVGV